MVKILGLCASPRNGASAFVMEEALAEIRRAFPGQVETRGLFLAGKKLAPCIDCGVCLRKKSWCVLADDMEAITQDILWADGILVVTPVYVMSATPQLHALCSRLRPVRHCFPGALGEKFFSAVAVGGTRNGGQELAVNDVINLFGTRAMNLVTNAPGGYTGGKVWSQDAGADGADADEIGMATVLPLAKRLADVCLTYAYGKQARAAEGEANS